ncbi:MAG: DUF5685 family protein [Clostridia bacterium]|nr:DUF5685 family protein [Clostridia bacterium]
MFGYVVIDKPNILIKDYQTYRSYYCGLCKSIAKANSQVTRLTINYDIVVLTLLAVNYNNFDPSFKQGHCITHPIRKIEYVENNEIFETISHINTILGYYKASDDVVDEGKHRLVKSVLKPQYKKSKKVLPEFEKYVKTNYDILREQEERHVDVEKLSDTFGNILMATADVITKNPDKYLKELLFYLGKWVYTIDAYDDIKKDFKNKSFNPFLKNIDLVDKNFYDNLEGTIRTLLYSYIDRIMESYDKMDIKISEGPLSNIIYRGLKMRTELVINAKGEKCERIRI